jgi:hypothetical protein
MDLVFEYARAYGGVPRPDQSWHEVLAGVARVERFETRDKLTVADGVSLGQPPVDDGQAGIRALERVKAEREVYPLRGIRGV